MVTPFDKDYEELKPAGKYILVEIVQEKAEEKKLASGIIVPAAQRANAAPQFAIVRKVGPKVEVEVAVDDFVEVNAQLYPNIVDKDGYGKFQLLHEEQITGVYKKK
jgi:co-chaperonin GroES (HSP10)